MTYPESILQSPRKTSPIYFKLNLPSIPLDMFSVGKSHLYGIKETAVKLWPVCSVTDFFSCHTTN